MLSLSALALTAVVLSNQVAAQTSLWIPGLDPQPVTANQLGVGPDGATTWLLAPGVSSGTLGENGFFGPATLIAGPSSAEFIYSEAGQGLAGDEKCTIKGTEADCTAVVVVEGATSTLAITETVSPFPVQGGGPLSDSGAPAGSTPTTMPSQTSTPDSSSTPAAGSQRSTPGSSSTPASGASNSGSSTSAPAPTNTTNGATMVGYSAVAVWFAVSALGMLMAA